MAYFFLNRIALLKPAQWLIIFLFATLSWSGAFVYLTFNPDNYLHLYQLSEPLAVPIWVEVGRPFMYWFYKAFFFGSLQPPMQLLLGMACLVLCGLEAAILWRLSRNETLVLLLFTISFPFLVNVFGFETGKLSIPLSFLLAMYGYRLWVGGSFVSAILGSLLVAIGLSFYQNAFNFVSVAFWLALCFRTFPVYQASDQGLRGWREMITSGLPVAYFGAMSSGSILYVLASESVRRLVGAGFNPRYSSLSGTITFQEVMLQVREILAHYKYFIVLAHPLLSRLFSVGIGFCYIVILSSLIGVLLCRGKSFARGGIAAPASLWPFIFLAAAHFSVWTTDFFIPGSLLGSGYRHVLPVAYVFAAVTIFTFRILGHGKLRLMWAILTSLMLFSFAVTDQSWAYNTNRLYYYDRAILLRLSSVIAASPHYTSNLPLDIRGLLPKGSRPTGLQSKEFDVYGSALEWPGIARIVLNEQGFSNPAPSTLSQRSSCQALAHVSVGKEVAVSDGCALIDLSEIRVRPSPF
jgi:hypothetical protein